MHCKCKNGIVGQINGNTDCFLNIFMIEHYTALARLIELLRRAGKLEECPKYLEQVQKSIISKIILYPSADTLAT